MAKNNFSRSNVVESTLDISMPNRSSFDLSHQESLSVKLGRLTPVSIESVMPNSTLSGSLKPQLKFEKIMTPSLGRVRLDTHTFAVPMRRIDKDWEQFLQKVSGYENLASFNPYDYFSKFFAAVMSFDDDVETVNYLIKFKDLDHIWSGTPTPTALDDQGFYNMVIDRFTAFYDYLLAQSDELGYMKDFLSIEKQRISELSAPSATTIGDFLAKVLEPYFGIGSTLDFLGYPILRQYSALADSLNTLFASASTGGLYFDALYNSYVADIFDIVGLTLGGTIVLNNNPSNYSEYPLRANYATYYDYFRNWHVEKRENVLDPAAFGHTSILPAMSLSGQLDSSANISALSAFLQLLVLKYRSYARDYITTVQTDDIYRHVFVPGIAASSTAQTESITTGTESGSVLLNQIYQFTVDNVTSLFPFGKFQKTGSGSALAASSTIVNDLQTMRRANMLEKYLAREYYYPDTFDGWIKAHYGVEPADTNIYTSEYLGGDENFISGNENVANVGTEDTPVGTRTLVANASLTDKFNYNSNGEFAYVISYVSLLPLVQYDSCNMHLHETTRDQLPLPEFANDSRIEIRTSDLLRGFSPTIVNSGGTAVPRGILGFVPYAYQYRIHPDGVHGRYLTDYRSYQWFRDWYNIRGGVTELNAVGLREGDFALTPYSLRVHLPLDAFLGLDEWDDIAFGQVDIQCYCNCPLPAAIEFI